MPRLTYAPEGLEPTVYDFEFEKFLMPECIAISKVSGLDYSEFAQAFLRYNPAVVYAVFQVLAKRAGKDGKAIQPRAGELRPEIMPEEAREWLDRALEQFGTDPELWASDDRDVMVSLAQMCEVDLTEITGKPDPDPDPDEIVLDGADDEPVPAETEAPKA